MTQTAFTIITRTAPPPLPRPTEEQDIPIRVANLKPAKTIVGILERRAEGCFPIGKTIGKFGGERIRVWGIDVGVPSHGRMTLWIRQWRRVFIGLDEDLRSVAPADGKKRIPIRLLKSCLKAQLVAVESNGLIDIADNEERRNRLRRGSCHKIISPQRRRVRKENKVGKKLGDLGVSAVNRF